MFSNNLLREAPLITLALGDLGGEVRFLKGVINVIRGLQNTVEFGNAIIESPIIRKYYFRVMCVSKTPYEPIFVDIKQALNGTWRAGTCHRAGRR